MKVTLSWSTHNRRYTIGLKEFLATMGVDATEAQIKAAARKLLEQEEVKPE